MQIILASSSIYRKALLERLRLPFTTASPDINEAKLPQENPSQLAARLALEKARHVAGQFPEALVIGSDQVAVVDDRVLGKPGSRDNAIKQLLMANGKTVLFATGLCLYNSLDDSYQLDTVNFSVVFRSLEKAEIERYVDLEKPFNCAGSFKWEKLGIALFSKMEGDDVTALEGLPLIRLVDMFRNAGYPVL